MLNTLALKKCNKMRDSVCACSGAKCTAAADTANATANSEERGM
jgi:hypothetical protein